MAYHCGARPKIHVSLNTCGLLTQSRPQSYVTEQLSHNISCRISIFVTEEQETLLQRCKDATG